MKELVLDGGEKLFGRGWVMGLLHLLVSFLISPGRFSEVANVNCLKGRDVCRMPHNQR